MSERAPQASHRLVLQPRSRHEPINRAIAPPDAYNEPTAHACRVGKETLRLLTPHPASAVYPPTELAIAALTEEFPEAEIAVSQSSHGLCPSCFKAINNEDLPAAYWADGFQGRPLHLG